MLRMQTFLHFFFTHIYLYAILPYALKIIFKIMPSVQLWSIKPGWGSRPDIHVEMAHTDDVSGLKFSADGLILLSRSMDNTLKVHICTLFEQSTIYFFFWWIVSKIKKKTCTVSPFSMFLFLFFLLFLKTYLIDIIFIHFYFVKFTCVPHNSLHI